MSNAEYSLTKRLLPEDAAEVDRISRETGLAQARVINRLLRPGLEQLKRQGVASLLVSDPPSVGNDSGTPSDVAANET